MTEEEQQVVLRSRKMKALAEQKDFQELIVQDFILYGITNITLGENVDNDKARDQLKARKILHDYIHDIINTGEALIDELSQQNEGE